MKRKALILSLAAVAVGVLGAVLWVQAQPKKEAAGAAGPQTAVSRISQVTVYQNTALVTRDVEVPAAVGIMELTVAQLPPTVVESSLYSEGGEGLVVLSTRFRSRAVQEDTREEVRKLQTKHKEIIETNEKLQAEIDTIKQNMAMLMKLEDFTSATGKNATDKGTLNGETVITLTKYVMDSRSEKSKEMVTLTQQVKKNAEDLQFINRQLQELAAGSSRDERDAVIVLDKKNPGAASVRLNYLVNAASWKPQYKFRAGKDEKETVQLEYLAGVVQQTGEDWKDVTLKLSTAQPTFNAAPPDLKALDIAVMPRGAGQPDPMAMANPGLLAKNAEDARNYRGQAQQQLNSKMPAPGADLINKAAALEQTNEFLWLQRDDLQSKRGRGAFQEGQSVTYNLANKLTVPSRNDEQVLEVAKIKMEPEYFYKAVPVLTSHVYRLANLTNKSEYVLLPGEATMYLGADFVGRMDLPLVAIGEQFTGGFGVDPQLQITRQIIDKSKTMQGGNQVWKYDYRIQISSYKKDAVTVQLWDRLPKAENETVGVTMGKVEPELSSDPIYRRELFPNNLLRWDVKVEPGMNGEKVKVVKYDFKMELDKQMTIGSFLTK